MSLKNWKKFGFEFLSIFIAVLSAFALNNWNENRKARNAENKILIEIANGLEKDIEDIKMNTMGHELGLDACQYFMKVIAGQDVPLDSLMPYYSTLTRDFISIQNIGAYEALKSRGLDLIEDDELRLQIISLYEYDYNTLRKFEEEYAEMQYHKSYFEPINKLLIPNLVIDSTTSQITSIRTPLIMTETERNTFMVYIWKIYGNRAFILSFYKDIEEKVLKVEKAIREEID